MKTNEERTNSILKKVGEYKARKSSTISTAGVLVCLVLAIMLNTVVSDPELSYDNKTNETNLQVASNENKILAKFQSKEELVSKLTMLKFNYSKLRSYDAVSDLAESMPSVSVDSVAKEGGFSETNVQTKGIDEADIVKTDGNKIYYLSRYDNKIHVANTNKKLSLNKTIDLRDYKMNGREIYLTDKYIVVVGWGYYDYNENIEDKTETELLEIKKTIAIRRDNLTKVLVLDKSTFETVREVETEGDVLSSRMKDNRIILITNKYIPFYSDKLEDDILPIYRDTLVSGDYKEVNLSNISYFKGFEKIEDCSYMIITSFDVDDSNKEVQIDAYLGAGTEMYVSNDSLFVVRVSSDYEISPIGIDTEVAKAIGIDTTPSEVKTQIHKFNFEDGKINYTSTGEVTGRLLNQFSMDEYNGCFRITTTSNGGNNLYVLDENLKVIGSLENLAEGERIYATRFMGDKAYMVTYKTVDPLFVIDLVDPKMPKVLGELKIPGYSSYLHPLDETHLLGIGKDSIEKQIKNWEGKDEVVAYENGLKMAIFDISDFENPKETSSIKIGDRGSFSEAVDNHKAIMINSEEGIIGFAASVTESDGDYDNGVPGYGKEVFNGALIYNISVEEGISLRGKIDSQENGEEENFKEMIDRIIYIGNKLYTLSNNSIKSADIKTIKVLQILKLK